MKLPPLHLEKISIKAFPANRYKFFIETKIKIKEKIYVLNPPSLAFPKNIEYYFVIPSDSILTGEYDIITLCVNKNNGTVFYNNKKLII